ncbi:MAG: pyruvate kinase [Candidatus Heimdallarchaeota archaeon]|nr:pyruvate kinase [Candidatus Heimdallarchaeota archaeon]MDH5646151.1 pyruvate kinase [Candidatus Heimdallarchaeota archaeon]
MILDRAKGSIVGTIGPASDTPEMLEKLIDVGLDVVRLNLSHGTHDDHRKRFETIRDVNDQIPILMDLSGPKIRVGQMEKAVTLEKDQSLIITSENVVGTKEKFSISYPDLINQAIVGNHLFINDGLIEVEVIEKKKSELICKVIAGGPMSSRKGVNTPGIPIQLYAPTKKDLKDIAFSSKLEPDFFSVSFVRRKEDLAAVREEIALYTTDEIPLISKIEHQDGLDNLDDVLKHSNGIMVARGDLGVELPPETIPMIQSRLVKRCNELAMPCIVATQMLESMVNSPKPTRAEASDVATAILQGADAVMLSAETATGNFPVEAVDMMDKIIRNVQDKTSVKTSNFSLEKSSVAESIGRAAVSLADGLDADIIIAFTRTGSSSTLVSKFRPTQQILAITPSIKTARRARLKWGVVPHLINRDYIDSDEMIYTGIKTAYNDKLIDRNDRAVVVAGSLLGLPSSTNLITFVKVDDIISSLDAQDKFTKAYTLSTDKDNV